MKRFLKSLCSIMVALVLVIASFGTEVKAAVSYPSVFFYSDEDFENLIISDEAYVGDTVKIRMYWFAEFNHEGYDMVIYNSDGVAVASLSDTFTNVGYTRKFIIPWDTTGCEPGEYTVEVTKNFYSFYSWHEAPSKDHLYITLKGKGSSNSSPSKSSSSKKNSSKSDSLGKVRGLKLTNVEGKNVVVKYKSISGAKKYKIQYSLSKDFDSGVKTKKTNSNTKYIGKLKKNKTYYFRVRAINGNKTGDWSSVKKVKIKK